MDWTTHQVFNQFPELGDYDPLASDPALCEALARADAGWARPALDSYARRLGRADTYTLAQQANRHAPELHRFDTRGRRIDGVAHRGPGQGHHGHGALPLHPNAVSFSHRKPPSAKHAAAPKQYRIFTK